MRRLPRRLLQLLLVGAAILLGVTGGSWSGELGNCGVLAVRVACRSLRLGWAAVEEILVGGRGGEEEDWEGERVEAGAAGVDWSRQPVGESKRRKQQETEGAVEG